MSDTLRLAFCLALVDQTRPVATSPLRWACAEKARAFFDLRLFAQCLNQMTEEGFIVRVDMPDNTLAWQGTEKAIQFAADHAA